MSSLEELSIVGIDNNSPNVHESFKRGVFAKEVHNTMSGIPRTHLGLEQGSSMVITGEIVMVSTTSSRSNGNLPNIVVSHLLLIAFAFLLPFLYSLGPKNHIRLSFVSIRLLHRIEKLISGIEDWMIDEYGTYWDCGGWFATLGESLEEYGVEKLVINGLICEWLPIRVIGTLGGQLITVMAPLSQRLTSALSDKDSIKTFTATRANTMVMLADWGGISRGTDLPTNGS
ncbi:hypothetical protein Tco_0191378 [Tanacetum coccineum]